MLRRLLLLLPALFNCSHKLIYSTKQVFWQNGHLFWTNTWCIQRVLVGLFVSICINFRGFFTSVYPLFCLSIIHSKNKWIHFKYYLVIVVYLVNTGTHFLYNTFFFQCIKNTYINFNVSIGGSKYTNF